MFKELLPPSIAGDEKIKAFAEAFEKQFEKLYALTEIPCILPRINELSEEVLDLLAWQFHVDFWRSDLPIESKKELIKNSIEWHRYKGTPWAVKKLLEAVGVKGEVVEWFQEGTDLGPYEFGVRCWIERPLSSKELYGPDTVDDIKKIISVAKNARSWLAWISIAISFDIELKTAIDSLSLVQNKHRLNFSLYPLFDLIACDTTLLDLSPIENTQSITDKFLCQFSLGQEWTLDSYVGFLLDAQMCGTEGEFREAGSFMRRLIDFYVPFWFEGENYLKSKNFWNIECSFETSTYTTAKNNIEVVWEQGQTGLDSLPFFDQIALDFIPLDSFMEA